MASPIAVGNIFEITFFTRMFTQNALMVYHLRCDNVANGPVLDQDVANRMGTLFGPLIAACMDDDAEFLKTRAQIIWPVRLNYVESENGAQSGGIIGQGLPPQCCGLVRLRGTVADRHNRGRKYVPFPAEADSDESSRPTPGYRALLTALGEELADDHQVSAAIPDGIADLDPVIWNRANETHQDVVGFTVATAWATQRRRSFINRPDNPPG